TWSRSAAAGDPSQFPGRYAWAPQARLPPRRVAGGAGRSEFREARSRRLERLEARQRRLQVMEAEQPHPLEASEAELKRRQALRTARTARPQKRRAAKRTARSRADNGEPRYPPHRNRKRRSRALVAPCSRHRR